MNEMMDDPQLDHYLQTHYQNRYGSPPDPALMWERVAPHLTSRKQSVLWRKHFLDIAGRLHRPRLAQPAVSSRRTYAKPGMLVAALIVCLMVVFATTAYAFTIPVLGGLLKDLGIQQLQYSDFHQSKSIDGYTLSLDKVYADANLVIVGYTATAPTGQNPMLEFDMGNAKLSTEQGLNLPNAGGVETGPIAGINGNVFVFDASPIHGTPTSLNLQLAIHYGTKVQGSLTFDFSVPFHPGRIVNVNQSVTANGKTITLERIVISPSETRLYIQGLYYSPLTAFITELSVENHVFEPNGGYDGPGTWKIDFNNPLFEDQGVWTVTIRESVYVKSSQPNVYHRVAVKRADWVFHVTVPGA
jgi:hypothetical protein